MGMREEYGGMIEMAINVAVDKYLAEDKVEAEIIKYVKEKVSAELPELKQKLKANIIDLIDGQDDIKDVK